MCVCVWGVIVIYAFHRLYKVGWIAEFMEDVPQVIVICLIKCFSKLITAVCVYKLKSRLFSNICCAINILIIVHFPFLNSSWSSRITASVIVLSVLLILLYILYALFRSLNAPVIVTIVFITFLEEWNYVGTSPVWDIERVIQQVLRTVCNVVIRVNPL